MLREVITFCLVSFSAVFFVVDPFAAVPIFLAMTPLDAPEKRRRMALRACITAGTLLMSFALDWCPARIRSYLRGLRCTDARKRRMTWRILRRATWFSAAGLVRGIFGHGRNSGMLVPRWYES